jgi:hypothetical protein
MEEEKPWMESWKQAKLLAFKRTSIYTKHGRIDNNTKTHNLDARSKKANNKRNRPVIFLLRSTLNIMVFDTELVVLNIKHVSYIFG